jgi:hypothetical protein
MAVARYETSAGAGVGAFAPNEFKLARQAGSVLVELWASEIPARVAIDRRTLASYMILAGSSSFKIEIWFDMRIGRV